MKKKYLLALAIFAYTLLYSQEIRYINTENLNIRSGPGKNHAVVDTAPLGNSVTVISQSGNWTQIETQDGIKGYASTKFLSNNKTSTVIDEKAGTPTWQLIALVIALLLLYRFFGGKKSSSPSSGSPSRSRSTSKPDTSSITTNKSHPVSVNPSAPLTKKYFCKFCAVEKQNAYFLTSNKCSKSPNGYHQIYEGEVFDKYQCKFCAVEKQNLFFLTSNKCSKSPNGYHQAYEGVFKSKYICKYCSQEKQNLFFLTSNKCSKSPNGYHQPIL